ncbi:MAG: GNAT family protein [Brumimicrobium sp.]
MLKGEKIFLRQLESSDVSTLLLWENNPSNWRVSETEAPFSLQQMHSYIDNASEIRKNKQLRLLICEISSGDPVGAVDLFDISFKHRRAGIGILIADSAQRGKGFAKESLNIITKYSGEVLELSQLHCLIQDDNSNSISLFEKQGFIKMGEKKNWYFFKGEPIDAYFYQKFLNK